MVTIRDVAREAKVSVGSVSRYLNGFQLKPQNMLNIQSAIKKLNYEENIIAKGLKNNKSLSVGVVINSLTDVFATSIVTSLESHLEKNNYSIIICDYQEDSEKLERKLEFLKTRSVDGVILFHIEEPLPIFKEYQKAGIPIIAIDCPIKEFEADSIVVNNQGASFEVVTRLIEAGHEHIGLIAGTQNRYIGRERLSGYMKAISASQLEFDEQQVRIGDYKKESGYAEMKALLQQETPPTAVYVNNYYMTIGAVQAILESKKTIPEDISIIGFDHFELSDMLKPALTVVEQPVKKIGTVAGELILRRIKGDLTDFPTQIMLHTTLLWRESVKEI